MIKQSRDHSEFAGAAVAQHNHGLCLISEHRLQLPAWFHARVAGSCYTLSRLKSLTIRFPGEVCIG